MTEIENIEFPKSWVVAKLSDMVIDPKGDFVDGPFGSNLKASEYQAEGLPVFRIQNIKAGYFLDKNIQYVSEDKADELRRHSFKLGDIIITKLGEPLGLCCKVPEQYPKGVIVADLMRVTPSDLVVNTDYLVYVINSKIIQDQFKRITKGTTRARVNLTIVRDIHVPLAPLNEQNRIVEKLDELLSELEKGKEQLQTALEQLKVYRQSVLKSAFEGKLTNENVKEGELPKAWRWSGPEEIASHEKYSIGIGPFGSNLKVSDYKQEGVPLIFVKNITRRNFSLAPRFISKEKLNELYAHSVRPLDILVTKMGDPPGDCAIYPESFPEAVITSDCLKLRVNEKVANRKYIYYSLQTQQIKKQFGSITKGVAQKKISLQRFKSIQIPICDFEEQHLIVQEIESRLSVCDKMEETINQSLAESEVLRQSILKKAFEGKLVDQDFSDEPASKLLERIKGEKLSRVKVTKQRIKEHNII